MTTERIEGAVILDGETYYLFRDPEKQYASAFRSQLIPEQEGEAGQMVSAVWRRGFLEGSGESNRLHPDSAGYAFTEDMCPRGSYMGLKPRRIISAATTNALTDNKTYFFEDSDGTTTFVFALNGRYMYKMSVASNAITIHEEYDKGASAIGGPPAFFNDKAYIPLGASVDFQELTTVNTPITDDTFTNVTNSFRALAFCHEQDGQTPYIVRGYSTNQLARASTVPTTSGNWAQALDSTAFAVGDTTGTITQIIETAGGLLVAKTDDLWAWDPTGSAEKVFGLGGIPNANNGVGTFRLGTTDIVFYNHQQGLYCKWGGRIRAVGPDALKSNEFIPNISFEPKGGIHYEGVAASEKWIYSLYRITDGGTTKTFILAGELQNGNPFDIVWHTLALETAVLRGLYVDSLNRLWFGDTTNEKWGYHLLGQDGSPDAGRDAIGYGAISTTYRTYLPASDFGFPHTKKQLYSQEVYYDDITTDAPLQLGVQRDNEAIEDVAELIVDATTYHAVKYWDVFDPLRLDATECYKARPILKIVTTAAYSSTDATVDPRVYSVIMRALLRPEHHRAYEFLVDTTNPGAQPSQLSESLGAKARLEALQGGSPVTLEGPDGEEVYVAVSKVGDVEVKEAEAGVRWLIQVTAQEMKQEDLV